jgi:HK97 gp10 family phage protein
MARKLKSSNTVSATATLNLHTAEALFYVNEALYEATQEVVGFEAVATAKELCPVLPKPTSERIPGELRDSIDAKVRRDKKGVRARMTTATGYGGYVEQGTKNMTREPYLWPAFESNIGKLPAAVKERLTEFVTPDKIK